MRLLQLQRAPGPDARVHPARRGSQGYKTDWNNLAPSGSIAWRPDVQDGFLRTLLGDPNQATVRAGYSEAYERQGLTRFTDLYGGNRGASISLTRDATGLVPPGQSWPVLLSQKDRLSTATFNPDPTYPILVRANRADSVNAFAPDIEIARVRNWMVGRAVDLKDMAVEFAYVGNRGDNEWQRSTTTASPATTAAARRSAVRTSSPTVHGRVQAGDAEPRGQQRLGSREPRRIVRLLRLRNRHQPAAHLSIPEWQRRRQSRRLPTPRTPGRMPPSPAASRDRTRTRTRRPSIPTATSRAATRRRRRLRSELLHRQPRRGNANVTDSGQFSKYNALQLELRRRLSNGFSANLNYQCASRAARSSTASPSAAWTDIPSPATRRPPRDQDAGGLDTAVRPWPTVRQRHAPGLDAGRRLEHHRRRPRADGPDGPRQRAARRHEQERSAGRTSSTKAEPGDRHRRSVDAAGRHHPEHPRGVQHEQHDGRWLFHQPGTSPGPHIAPANSADCIQVKNGDCAPRSVMLLAPWFKRFDVGAAKRFGLGGSRNVEVRFDMLNVFDTPNFTPSAPPGPTRPPERPPASSG